MNKSLKKQLEEWYCEDTGMEEPIIVEPVLKPTESPQDSSNDINPNQHRLKFCEVLKSNE